MADRSCLYCKASGPFSDEHPLPRCLGKFKNAPVLVDRICVTCNNRVSGAEAQFCRSSPEALFRIVRGIAGRQHHSKPDPFLHGAGGGKPLMIVGRPPNGKYDVLFRVNPGTKTVSEMKQVILFGPEGQSFPVPLTDEITLLPHYREQLDVLKKEQGWTKVMVIAVEDEQPKIAKLLAEIGLKMSGEPEWIPAGEGGETPTVVTSVLSLDYFRAVAKIGFHYFLTQMPEFTGSEDCFAGVRRFIMEGGQVKDFVSWEPRPLLVGKPKRQGHVLVAEADYLRLKAKMQFFVGPDYQSQAFTVFLGENPSRVVAPTRSHCQFYVYFDQPEGGLDGAVVEAKGIANKLLH